MFTHQTHPAYYTCRRQLWINLPNAKRKCLTRFLHKHGVGNNLQSISDVWYTLFMCCSIIWLLSLAGWRYREFKLQANDPRFGGQWDQETSLYTQLSSIIFTLALFPVIIYASVCRTGHVANDSLYLGQDLIHLHRNLSKLTPSQCGWTKGSIDGLSNRGQTLEQRERSYSFDEERIDALMLKRRDDNLLKRFFTTLRPFNAVIYLVVIYVLFIPVCILEAEQLRNEAIHPRYVLHSNLDGLFGAPNLIQQISDGKFTVISNSAIGSSMQQNERPFPSHTYPTEPANVSMEYACLLSACILLAIRYAAPFYFTSRSFSLVFSFWISMSGLFILIDAASVSVLYKIALLGIREPGGTVILNIEPIDPLLSASHCVILSALAIPAILVNLAALFVYGEEQFTRALLNYAQLLFHRELPSSRLNAQAYRQHNKPDIPNSLISGYNPAMQNGNVGKSSDSNYAHSDSGHESLIGFPLTLAITTKFWRPTHLSQTKRKLTVMHPGLPTSNDSEASTTLKRTHGLNESVDLTNSVHTLTELSESGKSKGPKRSHCGLMTLTACSFIWLLITRVCLAGPLLRCYWATEVKIILVNIVFTIAFLIIWLLLWFAMGVKNAWRFRILHSLSHMRPRSNPHDFPINGAATIPYQTDSSALGPIQQIPGGYSAVWPYLSYVPWLPNGAMMNTGFADFQQTNSHLQATGNGSEVNSLYGCPQVPTSRSDVIPNDSNPIYQTHMMSINPHAGPSTVSDESDGIPGSIDPIHSNRQYIKHPTTYLNFSQPNPNYIPTYDSSSRGTSPMETGNQLLNLNETQIRCQSSNLKTSPRIAEVNEPTYATLASLNRSAKIPVRSSSAMSQLKNIGDQSINQYLTRGSSNKRNGSRVTFQDKNVEIFNEGAHGTQDGATASSDSGVYTNAHNPERLSRDDQSKQQAPSKSRYDSHARMRSISPRTRRYHQTADPDAVHLLANPEQNMGNFEVQTPTLLQPFSNVDMNVLGNSSEQLCSQV